MNRGEWKVKICVLFIGVGFIGGLLVLVMKKYCYVIVVGVDININEV